MPIWYYGEGSTRVSDRPFIQLDDDSDRAAGIVAGALVERRLEDAIKARLLKDDHLLNKLFHPSGAMGAFSVKIDFAYLLGIISSAGRSDLIIMKGIRNDFAHHFDFDSLKIVN